MAISLELDNTRNSSVSAEIVCSGLEAIKTRSAPGLIAPGQAGAAIRGKCASGRPLLSKRRKSGRRGVGWGGGMDAKRKSDAAVGGGGGRV